ncbi:hypothetical protein KBB68_04290, partial [Candidatus Babeliales bacterium]|nr:hypothetical protein [Candidatus Babeliales bacterium]
QDLCELKEALQLEVEIQKLKAEIQSIDYKVAQEASNFIDELKIVTVEKLKEELLSKLIAEKEANLALIDAKNKRFSDFNAKIKRLEMEQDKCRKSFFFVKPLRWFSGNEIEKVLEKNLKDPRAKKEQIVQDLAMLHHKQQELETKIAQIQNVIAEKQRTQEVELAQQNYEQDMLICSEKYVQNQHDACSFDLENCLNPGLQQKWSDRQNALFNTIEEGYKQFDQKFDLSPQVLGFLAAQGIDPKEFQNCFGTILQQQLHQEMCDILSQTALLQANYSYNSELVQSIVDFADAAHDANKNGQVLLAAELVDVDCSLLEIVEAIQPYGQALASGVVHSAVDLVHAASHPVETIQGLGKAICYVLKTVAINCQENGLGDVYMPLDEQSYLKTKEMLENFDHFRDQRNAEIVQALNNLGDQITNASGPEKFEALVRFGADFVVPGKIIHAVGGVCGAIKAETNIARAAELVAEAQEQTGSTKLINSIAENVSKVEQAVQEKIVQNVAENLLDAEKQFDKASKSISSYCVESARKDKYGIIKERSFIEKKISSLENAQKEAKIVRELPDGRIRYYEQEIPSNTQGPTRGRSHVTEFDPKTGRVRLWEECYDHVGNVNRIRPEMINGRDIVSQHYPATYKDIQCNIQGLKWFIPKR